MWTIHQYDEVASTQSLARSEFDERRASHGDVYIASHQTGGRGQYVWRRWDDEAGENLLTSIVLTDVPNSSIDLLQFVAALSVIHVVRKLLSEHDASFDSSQIRLKWPNDIYHHSKKIGGILSEAIWSNQLLRATITGIGLNVNQRRFSKGIAEKATSLALICDSSFDIATIHSLILAEFSSYIVLSADRQRLLEAIRAELKWMGELRQVSALLLDDTTLEALSIMGIDDSGALLVKTQNGKNYVLQQATLLF